MRYNVVFSCNPGNVTPPARSERVVEVDRWEDIPAACAKARNHPRAEDVTIISLYMMA